jgi:branched-chain amino acid transport system ATP-binding protein
MLDFVGLASKAHFQARHLSYGEQKTLEIARAMATQPELLLLDEPVAGMNPAEAEVVVALIHKINGQGITILLVEHAMKVLMGLSHLVTVLNYGEKICEGRPQEVSANPLVIEAYLGWET